MNGKPSPLTKDEEKGLLYGSLIAAGISAMSGRNIPDALQNAVLGFGAGYSGGYANLLAQKENELRRLREEEELKLRQLQYELQEKALGLQQREIEAQERKERLAEQRMADLSNYLITAGEAAGGRDLSKTIENLIKADRVDEAIRLLISTRGGFGGFTEADIKRLIEDDLEIRKFYDSVHKGLASDAVSILKARYPHIFGRLDTNQGLMLIQGKLPEAKNIAPEEMHEIKRYFYDTYLNLIDDKVVMGIIPREMRDNLASRASYWISGIPNIPVIEKSEGEPLPQPPPPRSPIDKAKDIIDKESHGAGAEFKKFTDIIKGLFIPSAEDLEKREEKRLEKEAIKRWLKRQEEKGKIRNTAG